MTVLESVQNVDPMIFNRVSCLTVSANLTPSSAACSSSRGIDSGLMGATRDFAAMILTHGFCCVLLLAYTIAAKALSDASTKVWSSMCVPTSYVITHRGIRMLLAVCTFSTHKFHIFCALSEIGVSQSFVSLCSSCIKILPWIVTFDISPSGSKTLMTKESTSRLLGFLILQSTSLGNFSRFT